jgi:hypothetical protein
MHPCLPTAAGWRSQAQPPVPKMRDNYFFFAATNFSFLAAIEMTL